METSTVPLFGKSLTLQSCSSPLGSANDFNDVVALEACQLATSPTFLQWTVLSKIGSRPPAAGSSRHRQKTRQFLPAQASCRDPGSSYAPTVAAQTRIVSAAGIRLDHRKSVRPFKGIFCNNISEFESYVPSQAVRSPLQDIELNDQRPSSWPKMSVHIHGVPTGAAAAFMMRPTRKPSRARHM